VYIEWAKWAKSKAPGLFAINAAPKKNEIEIEIEKRKKSVPKKNGISPPLDVAWL